MAHELCETITYRFRKKPRNFTCEDENEFMDEVEKHIGLDLSTTIEYLHRLRVKDVYSDHGVVSIFYDATNQGSDKIGKIIDERRRHFDRFRDIIVGGEEITVLEHQLELHDKDGKNIRSNIPDVDIVSLTPT